MTTRWLDVRSGRSVWIVRAADANGWPASPPWDSECFALLVATDRKLNVDTMPARALDQGLAAVAAWGPGCSHIEEAFDETIVGDGSRVETVETVILTTSHADASLADAVELFLDVLNPATSYSTRCLAWVVFAIGSIGDQVERALLERGATCERA